MDYRVPVDTGQVLRDAKLSRVAKMIAWATICIFSAVVYYYAS